MQGQCTRFFVGGVVNQVMGCLLFLMVVRRRDLPGRTVEARVDSAWKCLGNRAEYHACKHGTPPPDVKGKNVVILDFSFNNATTKKMISEADLQFEFIP